MRKFMFRSTLGGGDSDANLPPPEDYHVVKSEAIVSKRKKQYEYAIKRYTKALELCENSDKYCYLSRSKCYLAMGDSYRALCDTRNALAHDRNFYQAILLQADVHFFKGDFEQALICYHRGNRKRHGQLGFLIGIQKAEQAILNAIGSPDKVQLSLKGDLSFFAEQIEEEQQLRKKPQILKLPPNPKDRKRITSRTPKRELTIKQMLGEMYGDYKFLESLFKYDGVQEGKNNIILDNVDEALSLLDSRCDFWHQHKPMYCRQYDLQMFLKRYCRKSVIPDSYFTNELQQIDEDYNNGRYKESRKRAIRCLDRVDGYTEAQLSNRPALRAILNSCIGNAHLELGNYQKAQYNHLTDYNIGLKFGFEEAISRGLDNLGRVYARMGLYARALKMFEEKFPMVKDSLEMSWLCHEMGRCHLELDRNEKAREFGEMSLTAAQAAENQVWEMYATVLIAQSERKAHPELATPYFKKAAELAQTIGDDSALESLEKVLEADREAAALLEEKTRANEPSVHGSASAMSMTEADRVESRESSM